MALALYRKYRPRTFAEVIGQEHVTEPLSQALRSGRLNHAYLFSGPRGCGKTSSARILARSLNCEQGPTPEPCGVCLSCKSLANDGAGSIDVIEIDAASHGGVDDARELREKAFFAPANSRYKIYVIDEAHMVSSAGFNALLKLVEEPPEYVKFIFATTEPDKVLGTIRSRTHHYPFRLIPPATLRPYLQTLTEAEGVKVEPAVFPLVVRAGGGSARDSLSVLDQLIAGAGPDGVSYARAVALLGVTDAALIDEMCNALAAGDGAAAYETIDRVAEAGHDPRRYASDLLERLRDLIILQQVPDAVAKGLIDGPADQLEAMHGQAAVLGAATLSRCADIVHNGLVEMRGTTAPRLLLELITARMLLPGADDSAGALLQRLERLEKQGPISDVRAVAPVPSSGAEVVAPAGGPVAVAPDSAGGGGLAAARAAAAAAARGKAAGSARPVSPAAAPVSAVPASAPAPAVADPAPPAVAPVSAAPAVSAAPVAPAPASVAPVSAAPGGGPAEADWNQVADGGYYDDEPPWDEEPPADSEPAAPAPPRAGLPQVRTVWLAFGAKDDKIQAMQAHGIGLRDVDGETVRFTAPNPRYAERFLTYTDRIAAEFAGELGGRWQIRCDVGDAVAEAPARDNVAPQGRAPSADQAAGRDQATGRDQSAGRRMPAARPPSSAGSPAATSSAAPSSAAPERNTGRTESRPSRPQRAPATDDADDWPAASQPAPSTPLPPEPTDDHGPAAARSAPSGARPPESAGDSRSAPADPGPLPPEPADDPYADSASPSEPSAGEVQQSADTDWPEPVRPGTATLRSVPPPADDDWPEPVKPGSQPQAGGAVPAGSAYASAAPAGQVADSARATAVPAGLGSTAYSASDGGISAASTGPAMNPAGSAAASAAPAPTVEDRGSGSAPGPGAGVSAGPGAGVPAGSGSVGSGSVGSGSDGPAGSAIAAARAAAIAPQAAASAANAGASASGAGAVSGAPARSAAMEAARAAASRGGNASPNSGLAAARAAAANAGKPTTKAAAPSGGPGGSAWSDGTPIGEAPYDPEYDGAPPPQAGGFEGFDPGDEPSDEVIDEKTARQSSEEHALQLLRDAFGAEKIGEM
ncbi:DNA polymerase III subunit gamma and tau [Actinoplanes sp. L3-i22]|uniref:DNA polymerase III subunit gamma and tau n=1 Tax=Actinoplanes sp. L3-i22 TaxID=2836373 RepID=UPI001C77BA2B|nr:DNA polymerase III subunit gamma and tau [Actinoplanes sp. L3-i22]BCY15380.1 hypothetical protein L3i22_104680 [Actinoplanes sp. L3-i22]